LEAEDRERKRIASELHDGVGQLMSAARMNLSAFEHDFAIEDEKNKDRLTRIIALVDESCKEVRMVSHNMMPNALLSNGLANAVRSFIDKIDNSVLKIDLYNDGLETKIDANIEAVLYRVIQECVNNVIKHSKATHLAISLIKDDNGISISIEDNGIGFNVADQENQNGIGLKNIQSRIQFLKGQLDIDSRTGNGTFIAIHVPLS
jgi:two-component system NarL family sensor kinase